MVSYAVVKSNKRLNIYLIVIVLCIGRSFVIHKPKAFANIILVHYFNKAKLTSFQRQLNLYGFLRISNGRDAGGYYNEYFLRGRSYLCDKMTRTKVKGTGYKAASNPMHEPNFYAMPHVPPVAVKCQMESSLPPIVNVVQPDPTPMFATSFSMKHNSSLSPQVLSSTCKPDIHISLPISSHNDRSYSQDVFITKPSPTRLPPFTLNYINAAVQPTPTRSVPSYPKISDALDFNLNQGSFGMFNDDPDGAVVDDIVRLFSGEEKDDVSLGDADFGRIMECLINE